MDGHTVGVTLESGEELRAPVVMSGAHPKTTVLDMVGAEHFPDDVVEDMRRYKTRGGSVKVNWVLSELPKYEGATDDEQHKLVRSGVAFCPSIDYLERVPGGRVPVDDRLDADRRRLGDRDHVHPVRALRGGRLARGLARGVRPALPRHPRRARAERA
jgi:hypothetical protein